MAQSNDDRVTSLNVLNAVAYAANIGLVMGVPSLFSLPDNAELSNKYQTIVTPAGWAFAIWGVIFTMQAIWATLQLILPSFRTNPLVTHGVAYNYIVVCAVQVGWTFSFALEQMTMSMIWMLAILFFLFRIYQEQNKVLMEHDQESFNTNFWLQRFPFNLHLGWIVAATLVNFNVVLESYSAAAPIQFASAIVCLTIALLVGGAALLTQKDKSRSDVTIPMVLVWATNAISKELKDPREMILSTFSSQEIGVIKSGSMFAASALLGATVLLVAHALWKKHNSGSSEQERTLLN